MKYTFLPVLLLLSVFGSVFAQCPIDSCYHTRQELYDFVFQLQADYPQWVRVDSIGHSRGDMAGVQWPVYAVKISDNVQQFDDEPVVLIVMHIHAEEVIGLEASVRYMQELVDPPALRATERNNTQIYFIPTMNPDGLEVISDCVGPSCPNCIDITWRKNGYRPPALHGDCSIIPGVGEDSCGVDLNRNFELNWIYGDTLWKPDAREPFDYYRGPSPFSEPEARAVRDFALQIKPTVSIVYHSSRSGTIAEQSVVAWQWGNDPGPYKFPPDCTMIGLFNRRYVELTDIHPGIGHFSHTWGGTHNGCLQDWFYWRIGSLQALTETSPSNREIQPGCANLDTTINDMMPSLRWMARRVLNLDHDAPAPLAIYTKDLSDQAIVAEWRIMQTWNAGLPPRYTNETHGRMTILPPAGQTTIFARKEGFADTSATTTVQPGGNQQSITLRLRPLPWYNFSLHLVNSSNQPMEGRALIDGGYPRWVDVPVSGLTVQLPEGNYKLMALPLAGGGVTAWREFALGGDASMTIALPPPSLVMSESFENGLSDWQAEGSGNAWRLDADTTALGLGWSLYTNPEGFRPSYANNANTTIRRNQSISLAGGNIAYLEFYRRGRMDAPTDSLLVEVSTDGNTWEKAGGFSDHEVSWTTTFVNLSRWIGNNIQLRFRLVSDFAVGDLGMHIDNLRIYVGTDLDSPQPPAPAIYSYRLNSAYPNPFNPSTEINYEVAGPGAFTIAIYNLLGQRVRTFDLSAQLAGPRSLSWDGKTAAGLDAPTGLYVARMEAGSAHSALKLMLIR